MLRDQGVDGARDVKRHFVVESTHVVAALVAGRPGLVRVHVEEHEATLVVGVDQLVRNRRRVGQDAEPAEWIDAFEGLDCRRRHTLPADAVKKTAMSKEQAQQILSIFHVSD